MRQTYNPNVFDRITSYGANFPRKMAVGLILVVALLSFEIFNFDTTRYALRDLLGTVEFATIEWAAILAVAFCAIDFAGLLRIFTREKGADEPKEVWYLMGAWILGASMNAVMTWWAVSLTLLDNEFGNEVLSREELLRIVPIFVAVLVWLTRILFIGSFTVAGEHFFEFTGIRKEPRPSTSTYRQPTTQPTSYSQPAARPQQTVQRHTNTAPRRAQPAPKPKPRQTAVPYADNQNGPAFLDGLEREVVYEDMNYVTPQAQNRPTAAPRPAQGQSPSVQRKVAPRKPAQPPQPRNSRIKQRPPRPNGPRRP
jgi:hypothetical protein